MKRNANKAQEMSTRRHKQQSRIRQQMVGIPIIKLNAFLPRPFTSDDVSTSNTGIQVEPFTQACDMIKGQKKEYEHHRLTDTRNSSSL